MKTHKGPFLSRLCRMNDEDKEEKVHLESHIRMMHPKKERERHNSKLKLALYSHSGTIVKKSGRKLFFFLNETAQKVACLLLLFPGQHMHHHASIGKRRRELKRLEGRRRRVPGCYCTGSGEREKTWP